MLTALLAIFTLSRVALYTLFPFRVDFLPWLNQLLDVELLKYDLWASLWQLHVTPPLYNLYVGLMLKSFPEALLPYAFQALHFFLGLGMIAMVYAITRYFGAGPRMSFIAGLLIIVNPMLFRFEIIPFYTYPLAFLVTLSVWVFMKFVETGRRGWLIATLLVPLIILLTRNFFHVIFYFVPVAIWFCYLVYTTRRALFKTAVILSVVFFAIGLAPSIKNHIEYGIFSSSTWQGMQLFSMTYFVPKDKIFELVEEGVVSKIAEVPRFQDPEIYYDYYQLEERTGNPAVNAIKKSTGEGNYNNWIYAHAAKDYQAATLSIMSRYPQYFVERFINSVYIFFGTANYRYFDKPETWLVFDGSLVHRLYQATKYFVIPIVFAILFFTILWRLWKDRVNVVSLFILFNLLYVFAVANVVELGENDTSRVPIDPLIIVATVVTGYAVWQKRARHTRAATGVL